MARAPLTPALRLLCLLSLLAALPSLACAVGRLGEDDPLFIASGTRNVPTLDFSQQATEMSGSEAIPVETGVSAVGGIGAGGLPEVIVTPGPTLDPNRTPVLYYSQPGDWLPAVAARFGVDPEEITSPEPIPADGLIPANQLLIIAHGLSNTTLSDRLLPDSEFVYSAAATGFDIDRFVQEAGGYLSTYREWLGSTEWTSGSEIIRRVALENSVNPRLLLAILEYQSGWVYGQPANPLQVDYPLGYVEARRKGLYAQLVWSINILSTGYYRWRDGGLTELKFPDGITARLSPDLNAGSAGLQYYYSQIYTSDGWFRALEPNAGFPALYAQMFGDPWQRAAQTGPLFPDDLTQPGMILPFFIGQLWSHTGGAHGAWEHYGAMAALDFSPASDKSGCVTSPAWVLAAMPGLVVRSADGVVVLDMDGDGNESTGWAMLYLHVAYQGRARLGTWLETGDLIGHPSCEGGISTGTHVHIARKYNGEWMQINGPMPFVLGGWRAYAGDEPYEGTLQRDGQTVYASIYGSFESRITRQRDDP